MKKLIKILAAVSLLVSGLIFSGCQEGDEITEVLAGPKNTWCRMPVTYKNSDDASAQSASLYAYFYYTDYEVKAVGNTKPALKPGLNILVAPESDASNVISGLVSSAYILKNFPNDKTASVDEGDGDYVFTGSIEKWSAIYWAKKELRDNKNIVPPQYNNGTNLEWSSIKENFSWKRLLANYLLSVLDS